MKNQYNIYDFKLIGLFENYIIAVLYYYKKDQMAKRGRRSDIEILRSNHPDLFMYSNDFIVRYFFLLSTLEAQF